MDIESKPHADLILNESNGQPRNENSYLFVRLKEAFEFVSEKVLDTFTYSKFLEYNGGDSLADYEKSVIENLIHQLRINLRADFKEVFFQVCQKHKIQENLHNLTFELEKAKILKEFDQIVGHLFSQGPNYYFQFLSSVVSKLRQANEEVAISNLVDIIEPSTSPRHELIT